MGSILTGFRWERPVVTGGVGFLGSHLCTALVEQPAKSDVAITHVGIEAMRLDDLSAGSVEDLARLSEHPDFTVELGDAAEFPRIEGPVDLLFHFASPASPRDFSALSLRTGSQETVDILDLAHAKVCD